MPKYFFRIDDVSQTMDWKKFKRSINIFKKYDKDALLAIIPDNKSQRLNFGKPRDNFWKEIEDLKKQGWLISQHGSQHILHTKKNHRSEFVGLNFKQQNVLIRKGKKILEKKGLNSKIFVAPRDSFDLITLKALWENGFEYICNDMILYPFKKQNIVLLPAISLKPRKFLFGTPAFILHPSSMTNEQFEYLENFIRENKNYIGKFNELLFSYKQNSHIKNFFIVLINNIFQLIYYTLLRIYIIKKGLFIFR